MSVQIQLRRGTASEWSTANPILAEGEFALEKDTKLYKIGDGLNAWNDLPYGGPGGSSGIRVQSFTVSGPQATAKQITLSATPLNISETLVWHVGGSIQKFGVDFTIIGNKLDWNGLGMETIIDTNDEIIIQYKI